MDRKYEEFCTCGDHVTLENRPESPTVTAAIAEALQKAFNENDAELGANLLGDWFVVAEVHTGDGPVLRLIAGDETPIWRQEGMLKFALDDLANDILIYRLRSGEDD